MITSTSKTAPQVERYEVPRTRNEIDLKLDGNEGRAPSADVLRRAFERMVTTTSKGIGRYPDRSELEAALAQLSGVSIDRIFVSAGADDVLERLVRRLGPESSAVTTPPTFEMIPRYLSESAVVNEQVPWESGAFPTRQVIERAKSTSAKIIFAVSPNNPTGAVMTLRDVEDLAKSLPESLIVLDLVYGEFATEDLQHGALEFENVAVCRSLSKAWGIAGARVGWLIGSPDLVTRLRSTGSPYPISTPSLAIACELLSEGRQAIAPYIAQVRREREELEVVCEDLGLKALPSEANFVLVRSPDAERLWRDLASLGIAVRRFANRPALEGALRITLPGDTAEFERLEGALRTSLAPRALLFDMDGVLVDVSSSYREAVMQTAQSYGVTLEREEIAARKAEGNANDDWELTRSLLESRGVRVSLEEVTERFEGLYQGTPDAPGLRANERALVSAELLGRLSQRVCLGVVTGRPRSDAERFLEESGLREFFSVVIAREDAPLKPSPEPVRRALEALQLQEAWMIGDTPDDLSAARAAAVLPIGIAAPGDEPTVLEQAGAARVLKTLEDLEGLLP